MAQQEAPELQEMIHESEEEPIEADGSEDLQPVGQQEPPIDDDTPSKGQMRKDVLHIAWPSVAELVLISLCQTVDMIIVGRLHPYAIAAVGLTTQPKFILMSCFMALNVGCTALIARFKGAGDRKTANAVLRQGLLISFVLSILFSILGAVFARPLVEFMGSDNEMTINWAVEFFQIQMYGLIFMLMGQCVTAALRGVGNTRATMYLNITANLVNVFFNYCLVFGNLGFPRLEVAGSSIATVIGQLVACAGAFLILFRKRQYVFLQKGDSFRPDFTLIKRIIHIGLPAMLEQFMMRVGLLIFTKTITGLGALSFATHQICTQIQNFSFMNGQAFGIASTTLVGQSLGRKRPDLAKKYAAQAGWMGQMVSICIGVLFIIFGRGLISMFLGDVQTDGVDVEQILILGSYVLLVIAAMQPFQSSQLVLAGSLRGAGDTRFTAVSIFVGILIVRPVFSYLFVGAFEWGLIGAWGSMFLDQIVRFGLIQYRFRSGKWTSIKV